MVNSFMDVLTIQDADLLKRVNTVLFSLGIKIKMIRIANSQVKDYELIIRLFESIIKNIPDLDNTFEQISLFKKINIFV